MNNNEKYWTARQEINEQPLQLLILKALPISLHYPAYTWFNAYHSDGMVLSNTYGGKYDFVTSTKEWGNTPYLQKDIWIKISPRRRENISPVFKDWFQKKYGEYFWFTYETPSSLPNISRAQGDNMIHWSHFVSDKKTRNRIKGLFKENK